MFLKINSVETPLLLYVYKLKHLHIRSIRSS